jgi:hypothetical protein
VTQQDFAVCQHNQDSLLESDLLPPDLPAEQHLGPLVFQASRIDLKATKQDFAVQQLDQGAQVELDLLPPDLFVLRHQGSPDPQASDIVL